MPQLVTRVDDVLLEALDALVADGVVANRSEGVRSALEAMLERNRRDEVGRRIVEGYRHRPQTDQEGGWTDQASVGMIAEEPW